MARQALELIVGYGAIVLAFLVILASICAPRKHRKMIVVFALAGDWVTTSSGARVCQLRYPLSNGMTLQPGFCENWQPPFQPPAYAAPYPLREGWIRSNWPAQPGIQLHVEGKGWVP